MQIWFYCKLYLALIPVFLFIDFLWLGIIAKGFYQSRLGPVIGLQVNWTAAILFYLIYIAGIMFFAIRPAMHAHSLLQALGLGALFGFFTYATYDLTNLATIRDWPVTVAIVDIVWGMCLCALVSGIGFAISGRLR